MFWVLNKVLCRHVIKTAPLCPFCFLEILNALYRLLQIGHLRISRYLMQIWSIVLHTILIFVMFTAKFSPILIALNWSLGAIVFIRGETLSARSARPWKIPGWIAVVRENVSVNKRVFVCFLFPIIHLASTAFIKKVENNSIEFLNWCAEENLVVNNKDNRVFMSRIYRWSSENDPLRTPVDGDTICLMFSRSPRSRLVYPSWCYQDQITGKQMRLCLIPQRA